LRTLITYKFREVDTTHYTSSRIGPSRLTLRFQGGTLSTKLRISHCTNFSSVSRTKNWFSCSHTQ